MSSENEKQRVNVRKTTCAYAHTCINDPRESKEVEQNNN